MKVINENQIVIPLNMWRHSGGRIYNYLNERIGYDHYCFRSKPDSDTVVTFYNPTDITAFFLWYKKI